MRRLDAALKLIGKTGILADIGCDHGKLCRAALETGSAQKVYACDISAPSLDKARKLLDGFDAEFYVADGLKGVPRDFDTVAVCGMGAQTMLDILKDSSVEAPLVLQPQTLPHLIRSTMTERGYRLEREILAEERGRFYPVMRFVRGEQKLDPLRIRFGLNAHDPPAELVRMCEKLKKKYRNLPKTPQNAEILAAVEEVVSAAKK